MFKSYSPNMLKTYIACPKKFHFKYIKGISMPVNDETFELGKNIHALASYYLKNENISKMEQALNERERLIWEYLKKVSYFSYKTIGTEYNLSVKVGDYFFCGRLDALVKDGETYYILDYKTGSAPKNARYDFQTIIYLLAVKTFFNTEKVIFVYLDLKNKDEVKIELTNELISEYQKILLDTAEKIKKDLFEKKNKTCNCEYSKICY